MDTAPTRDGASAVEDPYVAEYPGVCGGYPVIRSTRIAVRHVVEFHRAGYTLDNFAEMWPHISREQILGALAYYDTYPARVDEDIERNERAWAEIIERNVPIQGRPWPA